MPNDNLDMENIESPDVVTDKQDNTQEEDATIDTKEKRHAEQLAWSRAEVERLRNLAIDTAFKAASHDISTLKDLYEQDPRLAKSTAEKFDRENSEFWSFQNFISWKQKSSGSSPKITEDELETMLQEREAKREHEKAEKLIEKLVGKLDEEEQDAVNRYIDKYKKSRITTEEAEELVEMATLYVNRSKLKESKKEEIIEKMSSTWISNSKKPEKDWDNLVVRRGKLVKLDD